MKQGRLQDSGGPPFQLLLTSMVKTALALMGLLGGMADMAAAVATWALGLTIIPSFDHPWQVSGLMHEWMLYMEMPRFWGPWTGKITVFFALQGPLLLAESQLPRALQQAGLPPLPSLLACALTGTLLMATATPFYFGAVEPPAGDLAPRVNKGVHDSFMAAAEVVLHHPQVAKAWAEVRRLAASGS
ncbi:uncharacterized protein HaLaN_20605 [Haematococcus lacustris]|uniref:Uncharacterized protein n=1 Tax=Haematococcus lacustris TaxID=44745 RepID=A0A699ZK89_HAELA|nr:uncharacterized protein HaLaN_20605 [Haematococcus lacustris]